MSMTRILLPIDPPLLEKVEAYRLAQRMPRTEAIRRLLEQGLAQAELPLLDRVLGLLRRMRPELEKQGVVSAGVFGSLARGEARPDSDIDIGLRIDPKADMDLLSYIGLTEGVREHVTAETGRDVDVVGFNSMIEDVRIEAERDFRAAF
ncbi:nucleotidyltransferase domain-containing protein [Ferrovibrio sp.]|uniref:nucleotidyltransferase family protein n=1 Tax=Ferrovibrio sp. TaxID=1917215 RepID=UPI0025BC83C0|nr:nucleotidyltransferase domain-containing protein [Ferrovibrio sp.]MBX3455647.1 nucleotidyltransferase domain-containing protein [Ferrovibrio sp.]